MGPAYQDDTKFVIVIESQIVMRNIPMFPQTVVLLFALHYAMNMHYAVHKNRPLYFFEFLQKVIFGLENKNLSPRMTTFCNSLKRAV